MERRYRLAVHRGYEDRSIGAIELLREVLVKELERRGRRVVEAGEAVELSNSVSAPPTANIYPLVVYTYPTPFSTLIFFPSPSGSFSSNGLSVCRHL
jgi:hypothetical protein